MILPEHEIRQLCNQPKGQMLLHVTMHMHYDGSCLVERGRRGTEVRVTEPYLHTNILTWPMILLIMKL